MYLPEPKPAKRARVWRDQIIIGNRWYKVWRWQRIGATGSGWESTWREAMKMATNWEQTRAAHKEQGKRVRLTAEVI